MKQMEESFPNTNGVEDDIENDLYRHPDRQGQPSQSFTKLHDIYALG
jgi:hypothetical protein